ncbi:SH3 domain-containing protein [Muricauda sp. 334s03]|uniref:SH3 domain-containing protein n=1 Tax=Flagellimonas yonaguniensis TaxID=3031325 RepID=A0ABT5XVD5_9FLAO|nr:SH3 domain-containing protein [[Muricauda] yonaguniensis]MDF0715149.1 SH3 domain-containing protein [[Muricauda] yonaguniensis]
MQIVKGLGLICAVLFLNVGCNSQSEKKTGSSNDSSISESTDLNSDEVSTAICLWPKVGLRDKPGRKDTKYLTTIYFGETVEYLNEKEKTEDDKEYLKVRLSDGSEDGGEAFYIEGLDSFENLSSNKLGIKTDLANVRNEPNINGEVLFQVEKGDICHIIAQGESLEKMHDVTDRWYKINFNGQEGWVFGYYTTKRRE